MNNARNPSDQAGKNQDDTAGQPGSKIGYGQGDNGKPGSSTGTQEGGSAGLGGNEQGGQPGTGSEVDDRDSSKGMGRSQSDG